MYLKLPAKVTRIIHTLQAHGHEAYAVGGCVRDTVLGRVPDDWDITTSARPLEVKKLFTRTVDTGLVHGTVTVLLGEDGYEVTTYRIDGKYEDHRHPSQVQFSAELAEDLRRRDFTINAMAYNQEQGLVDLFGGMDDLQKKRICCVGEARERFQEDALRILRAVRFSAQLGFSIEARTEEALQELSGDLAYVSAERIRVELVKLLGSGHPEYILRLFDLGIARVVLPEMEENGSGIKREVLEDAAGRLVQVPQEEPISLRLALFLHPLGEQTCRKVLRRLKFDNRTIDTVRRLVRWYGHPLGTTPAEVRQTAAQIGAGLFPMVLQIQGTYRDVAVARALWDEICKKNECISLKDMCISGDDLIQLGMEPGRAVGAMLAELFQEVLKEPACNTRPYLSESVKRKLGQ